MRELITLDAHRTLHLTNRDVGSEIRIQWSSSYWNLQIVDAVGAELMALIPSPNTASDSLGDLLLRINAVEGPAPNLTLEGTVFPRLFRARHVELILNGCILDGMLESVEFEGVSTLPSTSGTHPRSPGMRWGGAEFSLRSGRLRARTTNPGSIEIVDANRCDIRSDSSPLLSVQRASACEFEGIRLDIPAAGAAQRIGGSVVLARCLGLLDAGDRHLQIAGADFGVELRGGRLYRIQLSGSGELDLMQLLLQAEQAKVFNPDPDNFRALIRACKSEDQPVLAETLFGVVKDRAADPEVADKARMSRPVWNLSDGPGLLGQAATSLCAL